MKQVGRELGVRYVLEGSVRKAGNRVRITAQLIDASIGNHVWAERYDRELADIFAVQDEITERVVGTIEPQLYAAERFRSQRKPPESLDAWECVIRALSCIAQSSLAGYNEAEALCRRAIAISPGYGHAHSLLSWVLLRRTDWSGDVTSFLAEAEATVREALDLDEQDPWAHLTHGLVLYRQRRHGEAERAYRRALELNPNFALAHAVLGLPLAYRGAHREAVDSAESYLVEWDSRDEKGWTFDRDHTVHVIPTRETSTTLDLTGFTRLRWRVFAVPRFGHPGSASPWREVEGTPVTKIYK